MTWDVALIPPVQSRGSFQNCFGQQEITCFQINLLAGICFVYSFIFDYQISSLILLGLNYEQVAGSDAKVPTEFGWDSEIKDFLAWTTSKDYTVRLFYFGFAVLLYNMWLLVDLIVQLSLDIEHRYKPRVTAKTVPESRQKAT